MTAPVYALMIDWDADTSFTAETGRMVDFRIERGRDSLVNGERLTEVSPGYASITLDNYDGRYDPFNLDGELYGTIKPNRPMYLTATYDATTYNLFTGWVRKIITQSGRKLVRLECYDGIDWLKQQKDVLATYSATAELVDTAIETIIGLTSWDAADVSAEANLDTIGNVWCDPEESIWEELEEIRKAFFGELFVDAAGVLTYYMRTHLPEPTLTLSQSQALKNVELQQPWDEIRNDLEMTVYPRVTSATADTLYELKEKIFIAASGSTTIYAPYEVSGDPAVIVALNALATPADYTATRRGREPEDGPLGEPDHHADGLRDPGEAGAGEHERDLRPVRDEAGPEGPGEDDRRGVVKREEDASSQTNYGKLSLKLDTPWMQDFGGRRGRAERDGDHPGEGAEDPDGHDRRTPERAVPGRPVRRGRRWTSRSSGSRGITRSRRSTTAGRAERAARRGWRLEPTLMTLTSLWLLGTSELGVGTYLS